MNFPAPYGWRAGSDAWSVGERPAKRLFSIPPPGRTGYFAEVPLRKYSQLRTKFVGCCTRTGFAHADAICEAVKRDSELRRIDDAALLCPRAKSRHRPAADPQACHPHHGGYRGRERSAQRRRPRSNALNLLAQALDDRLLGFHVALEMDLRRTDFLYYVAASSAVLGDALTGIARYSTMFNEGIKLETELGQALRIGFEYAGISRRSDRHQFEAWTTAITRCCREITGRELQPTKVSIIHQRIPQSVEIDNFFGRAVEFGADQDEVSFAGEAAKLPVVQADRYLNRLLVEYCEDVLARRKARFGAIQADVENALAALLPHGQTGIESVAEKLRVSPRTLRRKLATEGITFAKILEDLRFALAKHHLAEQDLSISRIAWMLGYTEVSAFSHAFRRWSGRPPRAARSQRRRPTPPVRAKVRTAALTRQQMPRYGSPTQVFGPGSQVFAGRLYYVTAIQQESWIRPDHNDGHCYLFARDGADLHAAGPHLPASGNFTRAGRDRSRSDGESAGTGASI